MQFQHWVSQYSVEPQFFAWNSQGLSGWVWCTNCAPSIVWTYSRNECRLTSSLCCSHLASSCCDHTKNFQSPDWSRSSDLDASRLSGLGIYSRSLLCQTNVFDARWSSLWVLSTFAKLCSYQLPFVRVCHFGVFSLWSVVQEVWFSRELAHDASSLKCETCQHLGRGARRRQMATLRETQPKLASRRLFCQAS